MKLGVEHYDYNTSCGNNNIQGNDSDHGCIQHNDSDHVCLPEF